MALNNRPSGQPQAPSEALGERLDSWKEIAVYLRRSLRTVQRWEKEEALPVHRHVHDRLGSVYAYTAEVDAWWHNRSDRLETPAATHRGSGWRRPGTRLALAIGVLVPLLAAGLLWFYGTPSLEPATTTSQEAQRLLTQAIDLGYRNQWKAAEHVLRQALGHDPEFASARIWLAWSLWGQQRGRDPETLVHAEQARARSANLLDWERHFIDGSYAWLTGDHDRAMAAFEALVSIRPDDPWVRNQLGFLYSRAGRADQAIVQFVRQVELRPDDVHANVLAAQAVGIWGGDLGAASPYVARARALLDSQDLVSLMPYWEAWVRFFPALERWVAGDLTGTHAEVDRLTQTIGSRQGAMRDETAIYAGLFQLALGRPGAAEQAFETLSETQGRHHFLALVALARDDQRSFREQLAEQSRRSPAWYPPAEQLLVRAGLLEEGRALLARLKSAGATGGFVEVSEGELALAEGRPRDAIAALEAGISRLRHTGLAQFFLASEALASAFDQEGDSAKAVQVLEDAVRQQRRTYPTPGPSGFWWLRVQVRLAELYRRLGRHADAELLQDRIRRLAFTRPAPRAPAASAALPRRPAPGSARPESRTLREDDRPQPIPTTATALRAVRGARRR